jgi:tungsten cofactor oxidoreducase radical SAM maturase
MMHEFTMDLGRVCLEEETDLQYLYLEISNRCNLNCKMCFKQAWLDEEGDMEEGLFQKILDDTSEFPKLKMIYFGGIGEPLVHPLFMEMVREVRKRGISVGVSTNGYLLTDEIMREFIDLQVDLVYFSMDVIPMMPTEVGHPISEDTVEKLKRFKEMKNSFDSDLPHIGVESVITKENYHQLAELANFLTSFEIQAMIFSNILPSSEVFADLIAYDGKIDLSEELHKVYLKSCEDRGFLLKLPEFTLRTERHCDFVEKKTAIVRWDGEVAPCYRFLHTYPEIIFGRTKHVTAASFGNLMKASLKEIWTSREYLWFRYVVSHSLYPSCTDCPLMDACAYVQGTEMDCWSNMPSCGDCLWSRKIVLCPIPVAAFGKFR